MSIVDRILSQMSNVSRPQKKFLMILFSTIIVLRGRMNLRNLSRYSDLSEMTCLRYFRKSFDFAEFNHRLIEETIPSPHQKIAAIDCSFISKSGKKSYGIDSFWSGAAGHSKKGQEISLLSISSAMKTLMLPMSEPTQAPSREISENMKLSGQLALTISYACLRRSVPSTVNLPSTSVSQIGFLPG